MAFGSMYLSVKINKMKWTRGRLERSVKLASEAEIARDLCIEILKTDARTHKALGEIQLAETAFNAAKNQHYKVIGQAKREIKSLAQADGMDAQSLAQKFKLKALSGGK